MNPVAKWMWSFVDRFVHGKWQNASTCRLFRFSGLGGGRPRGSVVMSSGTPSGTHAMSLVSFDLRVEPRDPASSDEDDDEDSSRSGGGWFLGTVEPADDEGDSGTSKPLSPPPPPPVVVLDSSGLYGDPGLLVALFVALALPAVWFGWAELAEIGVVSIRVGWVLLAGCAVGGGPVLDGMVGVHDAWW